MITKEKLDKMDQCCHLLDAPAPEVCGELIEEIRRLRDALEKWQAGAAEILPPGANPSEAEVAKMFFDSFEELKGELAAARKALMVCDGAMMGKVNPKSVAFKLIREILYPENVKEHAPPPLKSEGKEIEKLHGGCCVSSCSFSSSDGGGA